MLTQFAPYLQKGDIPNLPRYHLYIKVSALESEEPFSGKTFIIRCQKIEQKSMDCLKFPRKTTPLFIKSLNRLKKLLLKDKKLMTDQKTIVIFDLKAVQAYVY